MPLRLHVRQTDDLKNEMIIPRSREPSIESVDAMEEMPAEEVQRLARQRLQAQMENLENFSSEELRRLARQELRQVKVGSTSHLTLVLH